VKFDVSPVIDIISKHYYVQFMNRKIEVLRLVVWFPWVNFFLNLKTNFNSKCRCSSNESTRIISQIGSHIETFGLPSVFSASKQKLLLVPVVLKSALVVSTVQKSVMGTW